MRGLIIARSEEYLYKPGLRGFLYQNQGNNKDKDEVERVDCEIAISGKIIKLQWQQIDCLGR